MQQHPVSSLPCPYKLHILRTKDQLDVTFYFISLLMCPTCFGYDYIHHQELATVLLNYHICHFVLGSLCVGDLVRLGLSGALKPSCSFVFPAYQCLYLHIFCVCPCTFDSNGIVLYLHIFCVCPCTFDSNGIVLFLNVSFMSMNKISCPHSVLRNRSSLRLRKCELVGRNCRQQSVVMKQLRRGCASADTVVCIFASKNTSEY